MTKSKSCLTALWLILAGVFIGYIIIPVVKPDIIGTPAFWLFTAGGTGAMLLVLFVLLYFMERGPKK